MVGSEMIADKIAFLCGRRGMTIAELADTCGMNRSTLVNIMNGKCRKPRIQTLYKIADAFQMTVREFLDFDPEEESETTS